MSVAAGTGKVAMTVALGTAIQMGLFYLGDTGITNEQSGALSILLYPFVEMAYNKLGVKLPNGDTAAPVTTP